MCDSVILRFISRLLYGFASAYRESKTAEIIGKLAVKMKMLFNESMFWNAIRKPERTTGYLENSSFFKIIQSIINYFLYILRKIYDKIAEYIKNSFMWHFISTLNTRFDIENSFTWRLVSILISRFEVILGLYIFIQTVLPHHMWYNSYALILALAVFLLYVIKCASDRRYGIEIKKFDFALLLFLLISFLSTVTSIVPRDSIRIFVINTIPFLLMIVMLNAIKNKQQLDTIIYFIIAGITIASLYGIWQYINGIEVDVRLVDVTVSGSIRRVFSTMGNPNNYAEYLILALPFYAAAFFNTKKDLTRTAILVLSALPLLNLYLTSSRASWIGFMVAVFVFIFLINRKLIPVFIILGVAMIPFIPDSIIRRLGTIGRDSSSLYRVNIWRGSFRMLKDYWVTGIGRGPGPFTKLINNYVTLDLPTHAHMVPLQIWLEKGLVGILSFVWLIARLVKKGMTSIFHKRDKYLSNIMAASIASLAGILTFGMVEYVWFYSRVQSMFWIVVGIFMVSINMDACKLTVNETPVK